MSSRYTFVRWAAGLGPLELVVIAASVAVGAFLIIDPIVLGATRSVDPGTYSVFRAFTHLGRSNWILIPSGIALIVLYWLRAQEISMLRRVAYGFASQILVFVFASIALTGLSASLIKNVLGRARPKLFDLYGSLEFQPMLFDSDFASFPSGHATTAGALAAVLAVLWPAARVPFFVAGGWIASTRFVIGAHYLSDVIVGFLFGAGMVYFLRHRLASRRWLFCFDSTGQPVLRGRRFLDEGMKRSVNRPADLLLNR